MSSSKTELRLETYRMPAANLNGENPLPPHPYSIWNHPYEIPAPDGEDYPDRGLEGQATPYLFQDQYDRVKKPREFKAAVLENEYLRATFLPELGGRLWSLVYKPSQTELLHVNPVFQPTNFAVRDAWFSGGVEWNIGVFGHCPLTCDSLFAGRVVADDGTPSLRIWEFERARRTPFQIDFTLPPGSRFLYARVRIVNANDIPMPMYWWSNIAVDEGPDTRVLVPADEGIRHDYDGMLKRGPLPVPRDIDVTYAGRRQFAGDQYFDVPAARRPWITSLDAKGRGLIQTSTSRLVGRKMFIWGISQGGRRWQKFLADESHNYVEIQAGLTKVQGQYKIMPPHAQWTWLEAYGLMEADPRVVHGSNWQAAYGIVDKTLEAALPRQTVDAELDRQAALAERKPVEVLHNGSGWGALENRRRAKAAQEPILPPAVLPFAESSLTAEQRPWLALLNDGALPYLPPTSAPGSLMVAPPWRELLEAAVASGKGNHWLSWFHLGVMRFRANDIPAAKAAWEQSLKLETNAWSVRQLSVLARDHDKDMERSNALAVQAYNLLPTCAPLAAECSFSFIIARQYRQHLEWFKALPASVAGNERIAMHAAVASLEVGDLPYVKTYLDSFMDGKHEIASLREGDGGLAELWLGLHAHLVAGREGVQITDELRKRLAKEYPVPAIIDFRMHAGS